MLDRCTDATERARARRGRATDAARASTPTEPGVGHARRQGMDLAAERLPPDGLIATTDADSEPAPDWLRAQLDAVAQGARAIGGRIELGAHDLPPAALAPARGRRRRSATRRSSARARASTTSSSGASLAVTAATYAQVGRLEPRARARGRGLRARAAPPRRADRAARRRARHDLRPPRRPRAAAASRSTCGATAGSPSAATTRDDFTLERLLAAKDRSVSA